MIHVTVPRRRRRARSAVLAAVAAVVVVGCSSAQDASSGGDGPVASGGGVEVADAPDAVELLADRDGVTVIDVRTPDEHAAGHLDGAVLLDLAGGQFEREVGDLDRDASYVLYCRTGARSADAAAIMDELGFADVTDAGGYDDLVTAGADVAG